jgi:hypothetical protein
MRVSRLSRDYAGNIALFPSGQVEADKFADLTP